jgi:hypothetical protein
MLRSLFFVTDGDSLLWITQFLGRAKVYGRARKKVKGKKMVRRKTKGGRSWFEWR